MSIVIVAVAALVAACVQAMSGLGFALLLTPVLFVLLSPESAIITVTALGIALIAPDRPQSGRRTRISP